MPALFAVLAVLPACRAKPVRQPPPYGQGGRGGATTPIDGDGTGGAPAAPDTAPPAEVGPGPATQLPLGQACTTASACASGFCSDGVCCNTACGAQCTACALPGLVGTCVNVPAGEDPRAVCPSEPPGSCGRAGGCDGMGRCLTYQLGTECKPLGCANGVETAAGHCDAAGVCRPGEARPCSSNQCSNGRCLQGCSGAASCPAGFECINAGCVGVGPALHWRFDDETGTTALDASGHGYDGAYVGEGGKKPEPSTSVPPTTFPNPRSRSFAATGRPAVQFAGVPAALKPANDLTVALWYRASTAAMGGTDIINLGNDYFVRLKPTDIELAKRVSNVSGMIYAVARATLPSHLDGKWHHVAGVTTATGMSLYHDGQLRGTNMRGEAIMYSGNALWAGRDGGGAMGRDFAGELDDVRIYTRALGAEEIATLAAGGGF